MAFTQPCFIRKNSPELRKKLEELGYEPNAYESFWEDDNRYIITTIGSQGYGYYTLCIKNCCLLEDELFIDCGTNEELFLVLAALRDDSDYMQWFTDGKKWFKFGGIVQNGFIIDKETHLLYHKATVKEIIEHIKKI